MWTFESLDLWTMLPHHVWFINQLIQKLKLLTFNSSKRWVILLIIKNKTRCFKEFKDWALDNFGSVFIFIIDGRIRIAPGGSCTRKKNDYFIFWFILDFFFRRPCCYFLWVLFFLFSFFPFSESFQSFKK